MRLKGVTALSIISEAKATEGGPGHTLLPPYKYDHVPSKQQLEEEREERQVIQGIYNYVARECENHAENGKGSLYIYCDKVEAFGDNPGFLCDNKKGQELSSDDDKYRDRTWRKVPLPRNDGEKARVAKGTCFVDKDSVPIDKRVQLEFIWGDALIDWRTENREMLVVRNIKEFRGLAWLRDHEIITNNFLPLEKMKLSDNNTAFADADDSPAPATPEFAKKNPELAKENPELAKATSGFGRQRIHKRKYSGSENVKPSSADSVDSLDSAKRRRKKHRRQLTQDMMIQQRPVPPAKMPKRLVRTNSEDNADFMRHVVES